MDESTTAAPGEDGSDPRRWRALSVALTAGFMTLLDVSIVNVALPSIRTALHAPDSALQWIVSGYALSFGLVLVAAGRLGDARGRRSMFILGVSLFAASSLAAGLSPNAWWLVGARLVQGVGGGIINPQVSGLIQQLFRGAERGRAFGRLGTTIGISTAVGPVLGGVLIAAFGAQNGWRWIFLVNLPVGALAIALALRYVDRDGRPGPARDLDPWGALLLGAGVVGVLWPLVSDQWSPGDAAALVAGLSLLVAFVAWERRLTASGRAADGADGPVRQARLRDGGVARPGLLLGLHRRRLRAHPVLPGGPGLLGPGGRHRDHALRARVGGLGGRRRPARAPVGPQGGRRRDPHRRGGSRTDRRRGRRRSAPVPGRLVDGGAAARRGSGQRAGDLTRTRR